MHQESKVIRVPPFPKLPERNRVIKEALYNRGDFVGAAIYDSKLLSGDAVLYCDNQEEKIALIEDIRLHKLISEKAQKHTGTVIATHRKLLSTNFGGSERVVVDEDIISTLLPVSSIKLSDINKLLWKLEDSEQQEFIRAYQQLNTLMPVKIPTPNDKLIQTAKWVSKEYNVALNNLINADFMLLDQRNNVFFIKRNIFPTYNSNVLLSATASSFIYEKLFSDRIKIYDLGEAEHAGEQLQYSNFSFSRSAIIKESYSKRVNLINEVFADRPVITFKKHRELFKNRSEIILENPTGSNVHEGQKICVVGTPHLNDTIYLLYAKVLRIAFTKDETKLKWLKVSRNNFEFNFMTYENLELRELQFSLIESALKQAVGRARTIRYKDASVVLFSNFPLAGFKQLNFSELSKHYSTL